MASMCRQVGLALGMAVVAAVLDAFPDVSAFHTAWVFMAVCGLAGGLTLLAGGLTLLAVGTEKRMKVDDLVMVPASESLV